MSIISNKNQHLLNLKRNRIPEDRNLTEGLRLNRNEKVDVWPKDFLMKVFEEKPDYFLSIYPDLTPLYKKISNFCSLKEENILVTSGIDGALKTIWEVSTKKSDKVGVLGPTYAMYSVYSKIFQTSLTEITYDPETLRLKWNDLINFIQLKPKVVFIPNPNQPIEDNLDLNKIEELTKKAKDSGTLIVIDEAYFLFGADTAIDLVNNYDNLVVTRTFSKGFGVPSIRTGFIASNEENMNIFSKTRFAHEANALNTAVAEYMLDHYEIVDSYIKQVIESRDSLKEKIRSLGIKCYGKKANFILIDLVSSDICRQTEAFLKENFIYVKSNFPKPWDKYILITVGPEHLMDRFFQKLKLVKEKLFK